MLAGPVVALKTRAVAIALGSGGSPILVLNVVHKGGEAPEETCDAEVVNHIEQPELCGVWKGKVTRKVLAELRVKVSEMVQEKRVDGRVRQSWRGG